MIRPSSLFLLFPLLLVGCGDDDDAPAAPAGQGGAGSGGAAGAGAGGSGGAGQGGAGGLSGSSGQGGAGAGQGGGGQGGGGEAGSAGSGQAGSAGEAGSAGSGGGGPLPSCPEQGACVLIEPGQGKHTIPSALFGDNIEWPENANGLWDEKAKAPTKNVVELLKPLGMTLLRFPGGTPSDFYHWAEAVGPTRKPQINPFQLDEQGQLSKQMPNFGPDEVASLAQQIGAKVFVTANVGTGTAEEAADWLKYYQGKGVEAPYWEVGNEVWITGDGIDAVTQRKTPEEYVTIFNAYAKALRAVNPGVQVGAIGCSNWLSTTLCQDPEWNQKVLSGITEKIDFFAVHNAYPLIVENYNEERDEALARSVLGSIQHIEGSFAEVEGQLTKLAKGDNAKAPVALTEFSSYYVPDIANDPKWIEALFRNRTVASALFSASVFQLLFRDERVSIATHLPLISAGFQSALATNSINQNPVLSVYGQVLKLYAEASGAQLVASSVAGSPTFSGEQTPFMPASKDVPTLDAVAVRKGPETWVYVINRDLQAPQTVTLALAQAQEVTAVSLTQLQGDSFRAKNTPESPDAVKTVTSSLTPSRQLELSLPPHSLSRVVFK